MGTAGRLGPGKLFLATAAAVAACLVWGVTPGRAQSALGPPMNLTMAPSGAFPGNATLVWDAPPNATTAVVPLDHYRAYYRLAGVCERWQKVSPSPENATVALAPLLPGTDYQAYVVAVDVDNLETVPSAVFNFTTPDLPGGIPAAPVIVASEVSAYAAEFELSASAPQLVTGQSVGLYYRRANPSDCDVHNRFDYPVVDDGDDAILTVAGLDQFDRYVMSLWVGDTNGTAGMRQVTAPLDVNTTFLDPGLVAPAATGIQMDKPTGTSVYVNWTYAGKPGDPLEGFWLYRRFPGDSLYRDRTYVTAAAAVPQDFAEVADNTQFGFRMRGLQPLTRYVVFVTADTQVAGEGLRSLSTSDDTVTVLVPTPPRSVSAKPSTASAVAVSWEAPSIQGHPGTFVESYEVTCVVVPGQDLNPPANGSAPLDTAVLRAIKPSTLAVDLVGLWTSSNGTMYTCTVQARNADGLSPVSESVVAITLPYVAEPDEIPGGLSTAAYSLFVFLATAGVLLCFAVGGIYYFRKRERDILVEALTHSIAMGASSYAVLILGTGLNTVDVIEFSDSDDGDGRESSARRANRTRTVALDEWSDMDFDNPADLTTLNSIYDADDLANEGISMNEIENSYQPELGVMRRRGSLAADPVARLYEDSPASAMSSGTSLAATDQFLAPPTDRRV